MSASRRRAALRSFLDLLLAGLALAGVIQLLPSLHDLVNAARAPVVDQSGLRRNAAGTEQGLLAPFGDWVAARIRPRETIWIEPGGPGGDPAVYQWLTFRLTPNLHTASARLADVIVFYDVAKSPPPRPGFGPLQVYAPHYALMRRLNR